MRVRVAVALVCLLAVAIPGQSQVTIQHGSTLSELIDNLYRGNGIQLRETGHQAHFGESADFQEFSRTLQDVLQSRPLFPIPSSVGLVSYRFNEETGTYDRVQGSFGPLLADRGTTTGKGNVNIAVTYTFTEFDSFDGNEEVDLTLRHCLLPSCVSNIASPFLQDTIRVQLQMRLKSQALTTSVIYGLTNRVDVGIVIPYLRNDLEIFTHGSIVYGPQSGPESPHAFDPQVETPDQLGTAHAIGIGDIVARAKLRLSEKLPFDVALLTDVSLPSGQKENFLGTGSTRIKETIILSGNGTRFTPHLNLGFELNTDQNELSNLDYRFGTELLASPRLTLSADLLGVNRPFLKDSFAARALDGRSLIGRSELDGAFGGKLAISKRAVFLFNLLTPLNASGVRPNSSMTFGVQLGL